MKKILSVILCFCLFTSMATGACADGNDISGDFQVEYQAPALHDVGELSVTYNAPEQHDTFDPTVERTLIGETMIGQEENAQVLAEEAHFADSEEIPFDEASYQPEELVERQDQAAAAWREESRESGTRRRASGARMSFSQLRAKYPSGKYWNHANNPGNTKEFNNADSWTDIPCPESHTDMIDTELQTCNAYWPGDYMIGLQCYGYADKLGFDATGIDPETWEKKTYSGALYDLKAGDIVRINNNSGGQHSIFVIDVEGEKVIYTDCNEGGTCIIRWDQKTTKSELASRFEYQKICPIDAFVEDEYCHCSSNCFGVYTASRQLNIFAAHKLNGSVVGSIPGGANVSVNAGDAELFHVSYNGISGYADARYLSKRADAVLQPNWNILSLTIPDHQTERVRLYCSGSLPSRYSISADFVGGISLAWVGWEGNTCGVIDVTALQPVDGKVVFYLCNESGQRVAACELQVKINTARTFLSIDGNYLRKGYSIDADRQNSTTIRLTAGGYLPDSFSFWILRTTYDICKFSWPGDWKDNGLSHDLSIEAGYQGDSKIIVGLVCQNTVRATAEIDLTVSGTVHVVPVPDKVNLNLPDVKERTVTYLVTGVLPRQFGLWVTDISGNSFSTENSGDFYDRDGTLAIDMKVKGVRAGSGNITSKLWDSQYADNQVVKAICVLPVTVWQRSMAKPNFVIPPRVESISDETFSSINATTVRIPYGVTRIGSKAFASNRALSEIYIPASVTSIESDAFEGVSGLTVFGASGSYAELYSNDKKFNFVPVN